MHASDMDYEAAAIALNAQQTNRRLGQRVAELEQRVAALEAAARDVDPTDLDPSDPEKSLAHTFAFVADLMKKAGDTGEATE